jgi:hypothetical protein
MVMRNVGGSLVRREEHSERERLRVLVDRLGEDELTIPVNDHWTVGAVFGHIAFWDGRALALADKLERGVPFSPSDTKPEDVEAMDRMWPRDPDSPLYPLRADHRGEHLDDVEAVLRARSGPTGHDIT